MKLFFEGQEEIGSPTLPNFVGENRDLFTCDLVISSDGSQWSETEPAILVGLRGGVAVEIDDATGLTRAIAPLRRGGRLSQTEPQFWL